MKKLKEYIKNEICFGEANHDIYYNVDEDRFWNETYVGNRYAIETDSIFIGSIKGNTDWSSMCDTCEKYMCPGIDECRADSIAQDFKNSFEFRESVMRWIDARYEKQIEELSDDYYMALKRITKHFIDDDLKGDSIEKWFKKT